MSSPIDFIILAILYSTILFPYPPRKPLNRRQENTLNPIIPGVWKPYSALGHILNRKFPYCNVLGISLLGVAGGVAVGVVVGVAVGVAVALVVCVKCAFSVTGSFIRMDIS